VSRPAILLAGAGGHARACVDVIERAGILEVAGFLGLGPEVGTRVLGYPVLGSDDAVPPGVARCGLVAVGQIKSPETRMRLFALLERAGLELPVIVSPDAVVSRHARLGAGTIVLHGAVVNAAAVVGRNCIINSQALVEHDVVIGDHCHVSTAAAINSGVWVGDGVFIGSGVVVRQGVRIGERCVVGMGQRVLVDCEAGSHVPPMRETS
jgi:sugar O-acyltransferase (sialic acid O-acetyltransferase NeuD family)